jgi:hypothetical protein
MNKLTNSRVVREENKRRIEKQKQVFELLGKHKYAMFSDRVCSKSEDLHNVIPQQKVILS